MKPVSLLWQVQPVRDGRAWRRRRPESSESVPGVPALPLVLGGVLGPAGIRLPASVKRILQNNPLRLWNKDNCDSYHVAQCFQRNLGNAGIRLHNWLKIITWWLDTAYKKALIPAEWTLLKILTLGLGPGLGNTVSKHRDWWNNPLYRKRF